MAGKWVKSLQCKSRSVDDVFSPLPKHQPLILPSVSCRNSFQGLKDVVVVKPNPTNTIHFRPKSKPRPEPEPEPDKPVSVSVSVSPGLFPSLSSLSEGHASRNVVEIIFRTRWAPKSAFPGRVEMVFKVHNSGRTLARFEEYREAVKSRGAAGSEERPMRCVADGNEMMRFYCLGPTSSGAGGIWEINGGGKGVAPFGTFSGSGAAHDSAGGGNGRRAMLVCRVIAGRVGLDPVNKGFDSASGENGGELLVFDARALLPCFLVIYKL